MGQDIAFPVVISPTGVQMVHPDAEIGIARVRQTNIEGYADRMDD